MIAQIVIHCLKFLLVLKHLLQSVTQRVKVFREIFLQCRESPVKSFVS